MYQALYRKYRPRTFSDVVGQDHITRTLQRQVELGRTSHAYLFVGTRGTGKTTCAKILSRALNCEHPVNGDPCNCCPSCTGIESGSILDVVEIDAASNNGIDNIRAIREEAMYSPASVRKRVYIIDEVHMLSNSAFNALLKILEEPPEHLVFILATTELNKVPATILSRCQRFSFKRIMPEDIEKRIRYIAGEEQIEITDGAVSLLARLGDGSMRDSLSLLDQCLTDGLIDENRVLSAVGLSGAAETAELWESLRAGDLSSALGSFERQYMNGTDPSSILSGLLSLIRDMMLVKIAPKASSSVLSGTFGAPQLASMSSGMKTSQLISCSDTIQDSLSKISLLKDKRAAAEVSLIKLSNLLKGSDAVQGELSPETYISPVQEATPATLPPSASETRRTENAPRREEPQEARKAPVHTPVNNMETKVPSATEQAGSAPPRRERKAPQDTKIPDSQPSDLWERIIKRLPSSKDMAFINDTSSVTAKNSGSNLSIVTNNDFYLLMLSRPETKELIAGAASAELGKTVTVSIEKGVVTQELRTDKLDELSKFQNVKFIN